MSFKTPLHDWHIDHSAKMVNFGGWHMPLHYGSQIEEHHLVRQKSGWFDVSHMTMVDVEGDDACEFLRWLLANDVNKLTRKWQALYSVLLNLEGHVLDDLIVYRMDNGFRLVLNASNRERNLAWMIQQSERFAQGISQIPKIIWRSDLSLLAVQGPESEQIVSQQLGASYQSALANLKPFECFECGDLFVARTGYTGENGYEIAMPNDQATYWANQLVKSGVSPIGLGARDSLRLEAGMNLCGQDMNDTTSPIESNLSWTIAWQPEERDFIGRKAMSDILLVEKRRMVGVVAYGRSVLRAHQILRGEGLMGEITSGGYSPTLSRAIGLARVSHSVPIGAKMEVCIRDQWHPVQVVPLPFIRHGQVKIALP